MLPIKYLGHIKQVFGSNLVIGNGAKICINKKIHHKGQKGPITLFLHLQHDSNASVSEGDLQEGIVVMGGDSCLRGRQFESQCRILDGSFVTNICFIKVVLLLKKDYLL